VPVGLAVPLALAALMNSKNLWAKPVFRTLFYLPTILPFIATVYIWQGVLNDQTGWLNKALETVAIPGPDWLTSTTWIFPALLLVSLWGIGNTFLTLMAGMQGVSTELYEAARVDGAGPLTIFFQITIPMISPVIFYNLTLILIATFQYFLIPYVLVPGPNGEPGRSTFFYNLYLFKSFFTYQDMAYGATLAWVLFIIVLAVTAALFGSARYWVYYAAGEEKR
jgi:multiple sugar transport system permease protein